MNHRRLALALLAAAAALGAEEARPLRTDDAGVADALRRFAAHERSDKGIPGLGLVLVEDQDVALAASLGFLVSSKPPARPALSP